MNRHLQIFGVLLIFSVLLFSCATAKSAPASDSGEMEPASRRASEMPDDERMVTYSVSLSLNVKNPEETREILLEQVKSNNGFIVRETENFITTRIPAENMDDFINTQGRLDK